MKRKPGVKVAGVSPEIVLALCLVDSVCLKRAVEFTITSITEGRHSTNSLHYSGYAFDMRSRDLNDGQIAALVVDLRNALGDEFDVVIEPDHIHIEFYLK